MPISNRHASTRPVMPAPSLLGLRTLSCCLGLSMLLVQQVWAFERLELDLGSLEGPDWRVEQLRFTLDWGEDETAYRVEIARLRIPALQQTFNGVKIDCKRGVIETDRIACEAGTANLADPRLDAPVMGLRFELDRDSGRLTASLQGVSIAGGSLDLDLQLDTDEWQVQVQGQGLKAGDLAGFWPQMKERLDAWSLDGKLDLDGRLSGRGGKLHSARWQGKFAGLSFGDEAGRYAGAGLGVVFNGQLLAHGANWQVDSAWELKQGELLTPGFYLDAAVHPLTLQGKLALDGVYTTLTLRDVTLKQPGLLDLALDGVVAVSGEPSVERLGLHLAPVPVWPLYRDMLQPVLAGTPWGRFELAGEVDLELDWEGNDLALALGLSAFSLDDVPRDAIVKRLGLYDMNGHLYWDRNGQPRTSRLSWQAGHLLEHIDIGPGEIEFQAHDRRVELRRQARIPILDGALVIDRLDLQAVASEAQTLQFDGFIEPISMDALSQALGWVPLTGKLSGMLPGLKYEQGLLSVDGVVLVRMFDGDILIKQLETRDLFGVYPQLSADIELRDLDLERLTRTFSFGRITGRLDGYVRDLKLEQWSPVVFDARFYTPKHDDSRHRISQKAVDNISNLGGAGMSGALARSFMRFFEEFSYKRIGIGCRLQNGICNMTGAGKAEQGYYLVEGSGIPRIDIIGFNSTADWSRLLEQLKQIASSPPPTID